MSSTASLDGSYEDSLANEKSDLVSTQQYKDQSLQWIDKVICNSKQSRLI
jgi:hypothetical protein